MNKSILKRVLPHGFEASTAVKERTTSSFLASLKQLSLFYLLFAIPLFANAQDPDPPPLPADPDPFVSELLEPDSTNQGFVSPLVIPFNLPVRNQILILKIKNNEYTKTYKILY